MSKTKSVEREIKVHWKDAIDDRAARFQVSIDIATAARLQEHLFMYMRLFPLQRTVHASIAERLR